MLLTLESRLWYAVSECFDCNDNLLPTYLYCVTDGMVSVVARLDLLTWQCLCIYMYIIGEACACMQDSLHHLGRCNCRKLLTGVPSKLMPSVDCLHCRGHIGSGS